MMDFNPSSLFPDFIKGCALRFNLQDGLSPDTSSTRRYLSQMRGMYQDSEAMERLLEEDDPLVYEFHSLPLPAYAGDLAFGCSILYPGRVGDEFFMTKGHFHSERDTAEVYFCLRGEGYMMMEEAGGDWRALAIEPGKAVYVPKGYAHRSINVGSSEPLITFFVYRADAGHDYGTIEHKGFRKLMVQREGGAAVIDNPNWAGT